VSSYPAIYAVVRRIPPGRVATYGQVAALAGVAGQARLVGYALNALADTSPLPWHRVINAQGRGSASSDGAGSTLPQRIRLEAEGVVFGAGARVSLERYRWEPRPGKTGGKNGRPSTAARRESE